jgi:hypothetical protein
MGNLPGVVSVVFYREAPSPWRSLGRANIPQIPGGLDWSLAHPNGQHNREAEI